MAHLNSNGYIAEVYVYWLTIHVQFILQKRPDVCYGRGEKLDVTVLHSHIQQA